MNNQKNEKYEFLYQYARSSFDDELVRFRNIEDKASKFIGLVSIIIASYTAIIKFSGGVFFPPKNAFEWATAISIAFAFFTLASSWSFLFRSLKFVDMPRLPLDSEYIESFKGKEFATNHFLLAMTCSTALALARDSNKEKIKLLEKAYGEMSLSLLLLTITAYINNGDSKMSDKDKNQPIQQRTQVPPEPDFNATPPKVVMIQDCEIQKTKSGSEQINESKG